MKLFNSTKEEFITIFGEESFNLVSEHDVTVVLGDYEMFPDAAEVNAAAFVSHINLETMAVLDGSDKTELTLVLFPEKVSVATAGYPEHLVPRAIPSVIVHELEHVKQVRSGRLVQTVKEELYWEGEYYNVHKPLPSAYMHFPWEVEAMFAQFNYLHQSEELAARTLKYAQENIEQFV